MIPHVPGLTRLSPIRGYAVAAIAVILAALARGVIGEVLSDREPFPTFYVAVTIAAWYGGLGPTLFALALGYLIADWFFIEPQNALSAPTLARTGIYFFVGLSIAVFTEITRRAQARAEASADDARQKRDELEREIRVREQAEEALRHAREELERRVNARTAELAHANTSLQAEVAERRQAESARAELLDRLVTAQEEERGRIARELHDQMGQLLAALSLGLESLKETTPADPGLRSRLQGLRDLARQIGHEMHRLAWELGPSALEEFDLITALSNYAEEWSGHSGVSVQFHHYGPWDDRLPPPMETALYRIIQEALTNVLKHAKARRLSLILERRRDHILAIVEDDGVGFDPGAVNGPGRDGHRLGLTGMRQRVELVNGSIQIESTPGSGTTLFVRIPLSRMTPRKNDSELAKNENYL